jgi:preprotein translocase subunit YajC
MLFALQLWAQDGGQGVPNPLFNPMTIMLGLFLLLWLLVIRPSMKRQEAERQAMLNALEKNDRVLTSAGIYGTIAAVSETGDEITVKIDDNVKVKMTRASVARNLTKEEKAKAAAAESQAGK